MKHQSRRLAAWAAGSVAAAAFGTWACSPSSGGLDQGSFSSGPGSGGAGQSAAGAGSGLVTGTGSVTGGDGTGGGFIDFGSGGSGSHPDGGCYATVSTAEHVVTTVEVPVTTTVTTYKPFDMFIMYDQSGSMNDKTPKGTKWDVIKGALTGFVNDQQNADIGVGIAYFPLSPPACTTSGPNCNCINLFITTICIPTGGGSCNAPDYAVPDVGIAPLPGVAPAIVTSVGNHGPGGGTPTAPALQGALQYAEPWAAAHPDKKTIVVLATDGDPTGCSGNAVQDVANIAATGLSATPPVQTFVIGVGSSLTSLNQIAQYGGTGQAFIVDATTGDPAQQFLDAMNKIRESSTTTETHTETHTETQSTPVPCEWTIPASPPNGGTFDKGKVNVTYAVGGGTPTSIGYVDSESACANVDQGWHYDSADAPTKVQVCSQTCTAIQDSTVSLAFGCETVKARPR
ncbi:MAG TPA: vWA domain-containing protein [Polyangiaceae bacterium]|nr:vWA domain-containing protein [Polyangiaceae bacterium]